MDPCATEYHPFAARVSALDSPTRIVDAGQGRNFLAFDIRRYPEASC
jgi:hypothetical protein